MKVKKLKIKNGQNERIELRKRVINIDLEVIDNFNTYKRKDS